MGKHRPVANRIAEVQAQLAALMAKASKGTVNNDPAIQALDARIKDLNTEMLKFSRWKSESAEKEANFRGRAEQWRERGVTAEARLEKITSDLEDLRAERKTLAEKLALNNASA